MAEEGRKWSHIGPEGTTHKVFVLEESYRKEEQPKTVFLESKYRSSKIYASKEAAILAWLSQYNSPSTVMEKFELIKDEVVVNEQYTVPFAEKNSYSC